MAGETLQIRELTGSERSVELRGRALPYQGVEWGGEARHQKNNYPGNPVATIQVLGTDEAPTTLKGKWKDRFVGEAATIEGFDDVGGAFDILSGAITAQRLVAVFHMLRRAGNHLEVRWGPEVRRGILHEFTPRYDRVEDIEWTAMFVWSQVGENEAPPAASDVTTSQETLDASLINFEDVMSRVPPIIIPNVTGPIIFAEEAMRFAALAMSTGLGGITGIPVVSPAQFQGIASQAIQIGIAAQTIVQAASDQSIEEWIAHDVVADVLTAQTWRHDVAAAARAVWVAALEAREATRARVVDDYMAIVTVRQGQTLRTLALDYYGDADAWTTIADANGLASAVVPMGTMIGIPRRSRSTGAAA